MSPRAYWLLAIVALVVLGALAISIGSSTVTIADSWRALAGYGDATTITIVRALRVPRALLAMLVGAALAVSGASLQGTLRNALAEPYLLGVSGGAAVGAVIATDFGARLPAIVAVAALAGAIGAVLLVLLIARAAGAAGDPRVVLMAGVVLGAFANAVIMVGLANAPPDSVRGALWWMMGSVGSADWSTVRWLALAVVIGLGFLLHAAPAMDVLSLGTEPAAALGVDVDRAARRIYLGASVLAAAAVASAGLIGFIGLVVPNAARACGLRQHRLLLLGSAFGGAALVVAADLVARTARAPVELPLGAVTALLGVPFFLLRLNRVS